MIWTIFIYKIIKNLSPRALPPINQPTIKLCWHDWCRPTAVPFYIVDMMNTILLILLYTTMDYYVCKPLAFQPCKLVTKYRYRVIEELIVFFSYTIAFKSSSHSQYFITSNGILYQVLCNRCEMSRVTIEILCGTP